MKIIGYALCLDNKGNEFSLDLRKICPIIEPYSNDGSDEMIRIIDDSGEDYLFSTKRFAIINLPQIVEKQFLRTLELV